ncbi:MAG TPA: hypothetical protein VFH70_08235, partial [Acidimicrobiales bacterium]|nr:hypothetical protein [Acidimicrobiales bacterium]
MCGIVAVLPKPSSRTPAGAEAVASSVEAVVARLDEVISDLLVAGPEAIDRAAADLRAEEGRLRGPSGLRTLLGAPDALERIQAAAVAAAAVVTSAETALDAVAVRIPPAGQERYYSALVRLKDALWALSRDRIGMAHRVRGIRGERPIGDDTNLDGWWAIGVALASLDRLEVRGRDSAGVHILVAGAAVPVGEREVAARTGDPLFPSGSVRVS